MPYQVTLWACQTCHTQYDNQTEAQRCENTGTMRLEHQVGDRVRCMTPFPGCYGKAARVHRIEFNPDPCREPHVSLYKLRFEHDPSLFFSGTANTMVGIDDDAPQELPLPAEVCYAVESKPVGPLRTLWRRCGSLLRSLGCHD